MENNTLEIKQIEAEDLATYQCLSGTDQILASFQVERVFRFVARLLEDNGGNYIFI